MVHQETPIPENPNGWASRDTLVEWGAPDYDITLPRSRYMKERGESTNWHMADQSTTHRMLFMLMNSNKVWL